MSEGNIGDMGTKNNPGAFDCYANADPNEPMFVLLGRDKHAPALVREWADLREREGEDSRKVAEARQCADAMANYRSDLILKRRAKAEAISAMLAVPVVDCECVLKALNDNGSLVSDVLRFAKRAKCDWHDVLDFAVRFQRESK